MTVFENVYTILKTMFFPENWQAIENYEYLVSLVVFVLTCYIGFYAIVKPFVWLLKRIGSRVRDY